MNTAMAASLSRIQSHCTTRMVSTAKVENAIRSALPDAQVTVEDMTGGGDHLQVSVTSVAFAGLDRVRQHQLVYRALKAELDSEAIHNTDLPS